MTFTMPYGARVRVFDLGSGAKEFETSNAGGQVVSTVRQAGTQAAETVQALEVHAR